jgi:hypothetical protein
MDSVINNEEKEKPKFENIQNLSPSRLIKTKSMIKIKPTASKNIKRKNNKNDNNDKNNNDNDNK